VVGVLLSALQDGRRRTLKVAKSLPRLVYDVRPDVGHSAGTILYHVAAIEADWLWVDVLGEEFPPDVQALFPWPVRDAKGRLTHVAVGDPDDYVERLEEVRDRLLEVYRPMSLEDFRRRRAGPEFDVSAEWVLHHLIQHEATHRLGLAALRSRPPE